MEVRANVSIMVTIALISAIIIGFIPTPILLLLPVAVEAKVGIIDDHDYGRVYSGPRASMAVSGNNNIYLTWWDNKTGNNEVYFSGSSDGGKSFDKPINLSNAKGGSADSQIAASGNNVYVTWWDNKTGTWQVFSRASNDNGKTFGDSVILKSIGNSPVKTLKAPPSNTISVDTIVAAASGSNNSNNNEYVVWWDNTTGNSEISFAKSSDGGKTFGNPINISNSPDARSLGARMVAQVNNVYIAWMDIKSDGQKQVMFRASNDNGQTFGNPVVVYNGRGSSSGNNTAATTTTTSSP
jgi:hypothetical protein